MAKIIQLKDINNEKYYPNTIYKKIVNSNGTAIQYSDGTMICYGTKTFNNQSCNVDYWGFSNRSPENLSCTFASAFKEKPIVNLSFYCNVSGAISLYKTSDTTTTTTGTFGITVCKNSTSNRNITIDYIAIGKWK